MTSATDDQTSFIVTREQAGVSALEHVLGTGDLSQLTNEQRVGHYLRLSRSLGLNPLSRPFDWVYFKDPDGTEKLQLYPNQSCAAQLRRQHQIRVEVTRRENVGDLHVVEVRGTTPDGREDFASKYVPLSNRYGKLTGQQYASALMKAETGAKRRLTFSMVGFAVPPDPEDAGGWRPVVVDGTGMIVADPTPDQRYLAEAPHAARAIGEPVYEDTAVADEGLPSQAARPEELEQPKRPAGRSAAGTSSASQTTSRPTLKASPEQVERWQRTWFATVDQSSLQNDQARHDYVEAWTRSEGWPKAKQTNSLLTFLRRATQHEAEDFLAHVRAQVADEHLAAEQALAEARGEDQASLLDAAEKPADSRYPG